MPQYRIVSESSVGKPPTIRYNGGTYVFTLPVPSISVPRVLQDDKLQLTADGKLAPDDIALADRINTAIIALVRDDSAVTDYVAPEAPTTIDKTAKTLGVSADALRAFLESQRK